MKRIFLFLLLTLPLHAVFAQMKRSNQIIVDTKNESGKSRGHGSSSDFRDSSFVKIDAFKFNVTAIANGEFKFGYEHRLSPNASLDFEIGPSVGNLGDINRYYYSDVYDSSYVNYSQQSGRLGFVSSLSFRFYPSDVRAALNGFYVAPQFKFRYNRFYLYDVKNSLNDYNGSNSLAALSFIFGFQTWLSKHFALDYYAGIGIGYELDKTAVLDYTYNNGVYADYSWKAQTNKGYRNVFLIGLKVVIAN